MKSPLAGDEVREIPFECVRRAGLRNAYEIFITGTAGGVMPVTTVDGETVGNGRPGPVTLRLRRHYWEARDEDRWTPSVDHASDA